MSDRNLGVATAPARLRARTEPLPVGDGRRGEAASGGPGGDLLDHLGADGAAWLDAGHGFVTSGSAALVAPADAVAALAAIEHDHDTPLPASIGPKAVGALPFAGGGHLVIPARIVARDPGGRIWRTTIDGVPAGLGAPAGPPGGGVAGARSLTDFATWTASVHEILDLIAAGEVEKVVLAREIVVSARDRFDRRSVLDALRRTQPGCVVYADRGFAGASPELLVRRSGSHVRCRPMAGTAPTADGLLGSEKNEREHRLVVDAVLDALSRTCEDARAHGPAPVAFADVTHLATTIEAQLRASDVSAVDLALALHPTPAVAGTPRAAALAAITRLEPTPRGLYAGPCGWVDANGDGEFVVALRGAQIEGARARLHAGAGIVAGSDPRAEWDETQAKLEPMLRALG